MQNYLIIWAYYFCRGDWERVWLSGISTICLALFLFCNTNINTVKGSLHSQDIVVWLHLTLEDQLVFKKCIHSIIWGINGKIPDLWDTLIIHSDKGLTFEAQFWKLRMVVTLHFWLSWCTKLSYNACYQCSTTVLIISLRIWDRKWDSLFLTFYTELWYPLLCLFVNTYQLPQYNAFKSQPS